MDELFRTLESKGLTPLYCVMSENTIVIKIYQQPDVVYKRIR